MFDSHWHLNVDVARLRGLVADRLPIAAQRTPELWRRLTCRTDPWQAASCALLAAGLDVNPAAAVTIGDVDPSGTAVTVGDNEYGIEDGAQLYIRAQLAARQLAGAEPDAPLLWSTNGRTALKPRRIADAVNDLAVDTGLVVAPRRVPRTTPSAAEMLRRWDMTLTPLS